MVDLSVTLQILVNGILVGFLLALAAVGLSLVFGVMRVVNVAHGEFLMFAAYGTFWLFALWDVNPLVSMLPVAAVAAVGGYVLYQGMIRRIMDRDSLENDSLLLTFGVSLVFINLARLAWDTQRRSYFFLPGSYDVAGLQFGRAQLLASVFAVGLFGGVHLLLSRTQLGRAIRATAQNRKQADRLGINVYSIDAKTFVLASVLAACSGTLLSMFHATTPDMGFNFVLDSFVVMILGGLGSFAGAIVGALIYSVVEHMGNHLFDNPIGQVMALSMVFLVLTVKPSGLFGSPGRRG